MNANQIIRTLRAGPGHREARLFEEALTPPEIQPAQAWVRNLVTLLYTGYDVARVCEAADSGDWLQLGCAAIGRIESAGPESGLAPGELVLWNGPHADAARLDSIRSAWVRITGPVDPLLLLACVGAEASEGLRLALGGSPDAAATSVPSHAIVIGQGMLGHLAGQWLRHLGTQVTVVENSPKRLEFSKYLGLTLRVDTHNLKWRERVRELNPGGADLLVDACGYENPVRECLPFLHDEGKLLLLGNWRPGLDPAVMPTGLRAMLTERGITTLGPPPPFGGSPYHRQWLEVWTRLIGEGTIPVDRLITTHTPVSGAVMDLKRLTTGVKSICGVVIHWDA